MIIGKNNNSQQQPSFHSDFETRFNTVLEEGSKVQERRAPFGNSLESKKYTDVTNRNEMADKSFAMLQERLANGLISLDEFNKKCKALNKMRNSK